MEVGIALTFQQININKEMLELFKGRELNIGTSRDNPPKNSLGEWMQSNITKTAIASYVAPILINEGYAEKGDGIYILFLPKPL